MNRHVPVLLREVLANMPPARPGRPFLAADGTLGGGGHTAGILETDRGHHVTASDLDEEAIAAAQKRFARELKAGRLQLFHGSFTDLPEAPGDGYDMILADLGYSSNQLEDPTYGMSFQVDGPLDMRLSRPPEGPTAWDILSDAPLPWLTSTLRSYGEMPGAERLAKKLREAVDSGQVVNSTLSLARWAEKNSPSGRGRGKGRIHPATTLFQALRIAVNDELRTLDQFLQSAILKLRVGGRLMIITFHSLEDRIVKQACAESDELVAVTSKPVTPQEDEIDGNPRARSAKLRVYERA